MSMGCFGAALGYSCWVLFSDPVLLPKSLLPFSTEAQATGLALTDYEVLLGNVHVLFHTNDNSTHAHLHATQNTTQNNTTTTDTNNPTNLDFLNSMKVAVMARVESMVQTLADSGELTGPAGPAGTPGTVGQTGPKGDPGIGNQVGSPQPGFSNSPLGAIYINYGGGGGGGGGSTTPTVNPLPVFTPGSVMFAGSDGLMTEDTTGLVFNSLHDQLGIGVTTPIAGLDVASDQDMLLQLSTTDTPQLQVSSAGDLNLAGDITPFTDNINSLGDSTHRFKDLYANTVHLPSGLQANGILYLNNDKTISTTLPGGSGTLCLVSTNGGSPVFSSCAGDAGSSWSALTSASGNLNLSLGDFTTDFNFGAATGLNTNLFSIADSPGNTGTGYLLSLSTGVGSSLNPLSITLNGGATALSVEANGLVTVNALAVDSTNPVANLTLASDTQLPTITAAGKVSNSATTAVSANAAGSIVSRDGDGNFSAGVINASLLGNASTATSIAGILTAEHGGTGLASISTGGLLVGDDDGGLTVINPPDSGQILLGDDTNTPHFVTLSGDITIGSNGLATIGSNAVALGTDTTGNYIASISGSPELSISGSGTEGGAVTLGIASNSIGNSLLEFDTGQTLTATATPTFAGLSLGGTHTVGISVTEPSSNHTITIPGLTSDDAFAFLTATQTFTNKTISGLTNTFSNITNSALSNSSITISPGTGLSGGGSVSLGGTVSVTNTGVTGLNNVAGNITLAGSGIASVSGSGPTLTVTATEADTLASITGRGSSTSTGITLSGSSPLTLSGTTPTVTLSGGNTTVDITGSSSRTISILNSTASQTADLNLADGNLQVGNVVRLTNAGVLQNVTLDAGLITSGSLGLTNGGTGLSAVGSANQLIGINSGGTGAEYKTLSVGTNLSLSHGTGTMSIGLSTTPTFAGLTLGGTHTFGISVTEPSSNHTITIPGLTTDDTFGFLAATQTFTNKTISGVNNTLSNIANSSLTNSSITISPSTGLSGGGSVSLGGTVSLTNAGVTSLNSVTGDITLAGSGIASVSGGGSTLTVTATEADTLASITGRGSSTSTGLTLSSTSPLTLSGTTPTVTLSGGNTTIDLTGVASRTLTILNSTTSQTADLNLSDGNLQVGGTVRLTNAGVLQNVTLDASLVTSGSLGLTRGGTGLSAVGSANQLIGINSGGTGAEYKTLSVGTNLSLSHGTGTMSVTLSSTPSFTTINGLTLTAASDGLTISGGTTSRTLTITGGSVSINGGGNTLTLSADSSINQNLLTSSSPTFAGLTATSNGSIGGTLSVTGLTTLSAGANVTGTLAGVNSSIASGSLANTAVSGTCILNTNALGLAAFQSSATITTSYIFYNSTRSRHSRITSVSTCVDGSSNQWRILTLTDTITGNAAGDSYSVLNPGSSIGDSSTGFFNNFFGINLKSVVSTVTGGFDIAEQYQTTDTTITPGDVVALTGATTVAKANLPYSPLLLGVVSTSPGLVLGDEQEGTWVNIALSGRVPVHVSTENGPIQAGDTLTSSSTPGVAMKATTSGSIVGKALESYTGSNPGTILMFVENDVFAASPIAMTTQTVSLETLKAANGESLTIDNNVIFKGGITVTTINSASTLLELASDTLFIGRPYFNDDSGGFATITAGDTNVDITFTQPYSNLPVVNASQVTLKDDPDPAEKGVYQITNLNPDGFTITLPEAVPKNTTFTWTAIAVKNARWFESTPQVNQDYTNNQNNAN